jgi:hypothetical protein
MNAILSTKLRKKLKSLTYCEVNKYVAL